MKLILGVALALHLVACSSVTSDPPGASASGGQGGSGGQGASGGSGAAGGEQASGGTGGGVDECGPGGALDCHCPGGYFECENDRFVCVCPPECTSSDSCGSGSICVFYDGYCGGVSPGYCQSLAGAEEWQCEAEPSCGCDGNLYDSYCAAVAAGVSPNLAPASDCTAEPLPCTDEVACYPSQYCALFDDGTSPYAMCSTFDAGCAAPSCDCISYNEASCDCELLPSGLVKLTCLI